MTRACLRAASENTDWLKCISFYFEFWILKIGGYFPNWRSCGNCKRLLSENESLSLQVDFRLFCHNCDDDKRSWKISASGRKLFSKAQELPPEEFAKEVILQRQDLTEMSGILKRIISRVLDREVIDGKAFAIN